MKNYAEILEQLEEVVDSLYQVDNLTELKGKMSSDNYDDVFNIEVNAIQLINRLAALRANEPVQPGSLWVSNETSKTYVVEHQTSKYVKLKAFNNNRTDVFIRNDQFRTDFTKIK